MKAFLNELSKLGFEDAKLRQLYGVSANRSDKVSDAVDALDDDLTAGLSLLIPDAED